jgi:hypothetical protein
MTTERWTDLVATILDRFPVEARGDEPLEEGPGRLAFIVFTTPAGKMRLEFVTKPVITGRHTSGGRRMGVSTHVSYDYSDSEFTSSMHAYAWKDNDWQEIDAAAFMK